MPVQCVRVMSSSFSRPQLIVPSPTPFWPCSNSSNRRKFRGTTEMTFTMTYFIVTAEMMYPRDVCDTGYGSRRALNMVNLSHWISLRAIACTDRNWNALSLEGEKDIDERWKDPCVRSRLSVMPEIQGGFAIPDIRCQLRVCPRAKCSINV